MTNLLFQLALSFATIFSSKMTEEFTDKSIKNVPFSGKQADYKKWAKRFLSYAQMKKVKQILLGKEKTLQPLRFWRCSLKVKLL